MPQLDIDLAARQEARELARQAGAAQERLNKLDQGALDAIVAAMAAAFEPECAALAKMAVEETGFGNTQDKTEKNLFACKLPVPVLHTIYFSINKSIVWSIVIYSLLSFVIPERAVRIICMLICKHDLGCCRRNRSPFVCCNHRDYYSCVTIYLIFFIC